MMKKSLTKPKATVARPRREAANTTAPTVAAVREKQKPASKIPVGLPQLNRAAARPPPCQTESPLTVFRRPQESVNTVVPMKQILTEELVEAKADRDETFQQHDVTPPVIELHAEEEKDEDIAATAPTQVDTPHVIMDQPKHVLDAANPPKVNAEPLEELHVVPVPPPLEAKNNNTELVEKSVAISKKTACTPQPQHLIPRIVVIPPPNPPFSSNPYVNQTIPHPMQVPGHQYTAGQHEFPGGSHYPAVLQRYRFPGQQYELTEQQHLFSSVQHYRAGHESHQFPGQLYDPTGQRQFIPVQHYDTAGQPQRQLIPGQHYDPAGQHQRQLIPVQHYDTAGQPQRQLIPVQHYDPAGQPQRQLIPVQHYDTAGQRQLIPVQHYDPAGQHQRQFIPVQHYDTAGQRHQVPGVTPANIAYNFNFQGDHNSHTLNVSPNSSPTGTPNTSPTVTPPGSPNFEIATRTDTPHGEKSPQETCSTTLVKIEMPMVEFTDLYLYVKELERRAEDRRNILGLYVLPAQEEASCSGGTGPVLFSNPPA